MIKNTFFYFGCFNLQSAARRNGWFKTDKLCPFLCYFTILTSPQSMFYFVSIVLSNIKWRLRGEPNFQYIQDCEANSLKILILVSSVYKDCVRVKDGEMEDATTLEHYGNIRRRRPPSIEIFPILWQQIITQQTYKICCQSIF